MGVVHVDHGAVLRAGRRDPVEWGDVAVHREDPVGDHEDPSVARRMFLGGGEAAFEVARVRVFVDGPLGPGEADPVDDAAVIEFVRDDEVPLADELGDQTGVRREPGLVNEGSLGALEAGEPALELDVKVHRARDRADRAGPDPVGIDRTAGGLLELGVVAESEIIVGTEHQDPLSVDVAPGGARALKDPKTPVQLSVDELSVLDSEEGGGVAHVTTSVRGRPSRPASTRSAALPAAGRGSALDV